MHANDSSNVARSDCQGMHGHVVQVEFPRSTHNAQKTFQNDGSLLYRKMPHCPGMAAVAYHPQRELSAEPQTPIP
jgi:hypothetical protein